MISDKEIESGMAEVWPGLSIGGASSDSILSSLEGDDRLGAISVKYRRGNYAVYINRYEVGRSLRKKPLRWYFRWIVSIGLYPFCWSCEANYGGGCIGFNAITRRSGRRECEAWIDKQIATRGSV